MPRAGPSGAVFRRQCARGQNIRSPAPEPVQPYRSDRPCRRVGTLPKLCQIDACTVHDRRAQATPVPPTRRAMRLSGIDFAAPGRCREKTALDRLRRFDHARFNPRLPGGKATPHRRYAPEAAQNAPEAARSPQRARSRADASQKPAPRARRTAGAYGGARTDQHTRPRQRYAPALRARRRPERARSQPEARTARAPVRLARMVARVPTGVPARTGVTRQTPPRTRQERAASAYRALLRFSTITDPVRIRLRRPGIA